MMTLTNNRSQRGDTIVEVLIAIAVVGVVLVATFASVNRSLRGIQLSKDRSEALTLANSAITAIKQDIKKGSSDPSRVLKAGGSRGCLNASLELVSSSCPSSIGSNGYFTVNLERDPADDNQYKTEVNWQSATTGLDQNLVIVYRAEE